MQQHVSMTVTDDALIVRIPWNDVAKSLRPKTRKTKIKLTVKEVLNFVKEGRAAYRAGRLRSVDSLDDLR